MKLYIILFLSLCYGATSQLQINEVCSDNDEQLESDNGEYFDWLEIYNSSDNSVQLRDYYLSDDDEELEKWNFNNEILPAKSFIIVFASKSKEPITGEQHANFKLSSKGETLYLSNSNGLIDSMEFGAINEDYSYGRLEEKSKIRTHLAKPTPGESNSKSRTIIASRESGYYVSDFDLELMTAANQSIYYTTNGDDPTLESNLYETEIKIADEYDEYEYLDVPTTPDSSFGCKYAWQLPKSEITRCKVVSYRTINSSGITGKVYRKTFFQEQNHKLPVISIIIDNQSLFSQDTGIYVPGNAYDTLNPCWSGNYFIRGWEKTASISYFEETSRLFEENVGIRIHGGGTRNLPQKSIKFYARKKYGINKFENEFFPESDMNEFNSLLLRTNMADWNGTIIKDAITLDIVKNMNIEPTYTKPVVVYINGNYWGVSDLRNRLDENYLSEKYNISEDSINIISIDNPKWPRHGTFDDFEPLYNFIIENDLSIEKKMDTVAERMDLEMLIDYYVAEMYFANYDWPGNNFQLWNSPELDNKYRPLFYDLDGSWSNIQINMFDHISQLEHEDWPNPKRVNIVFQKLLENINFKNEFIDRTIHALENYFSFELIKPKINKFIADYESEIDNNIIRFGFPESKEKWLEDINTYITDFAKNRECVFREHFVNYFDLDSNLLCSLTSVVDSDSQWNLSPNPATNFISIRNLNSDYISIIDIHGTELMSIDSKSKTSLNVDISNLVPGVYFIKTDTKISKFIRIN